MRSHGPQKSICLMTNAYPDPAGPFPMYGRFIRELVDHLTRRDLAVSVVTPQLFPGGKTHETGKGERIYRFRFWSSGRLLVTYERIPVCRMLTYLVSGLVTGIRVVHGDSCQLIHAHWAFPAGLMAVVIGRLLTRPVIVTVHGSDARWAFEKKGLFKTLFVWVVKRADRVTVVNQTIASTMETLGINREKIEIFPMGVSKRFFPHGQTGSPPGEIGWKTVILSNRHLLPSYNVDCLIRAVPGVVSRCDRILFLIAGDGESRSGLESKVRKMDLIPWVRFLGPVPHEGMPDLLKSSHIFVSTSPSDGTSVSLLEAMACGLFPVVTDIPANREWIRNGENGFLTPPDDAAALAENLSRAAHDVKLRKRAKLINAKQVRERATWERISQNFIGIYERLGVRCGSSM